MPSLATRVAKHARINWQNLAAEAPSPPFLILFINSICNMKCDHCFYWQRLNQRSDMSLDEFVKLSEDMGPIENLNLSGGEPFLNRDFGPIVRQFVRKNGAREVYVPTNGWYTKKTVDAVTDVLREESLQGITIEFSLDGMPAFHDEFRHAEGAFGRAMETYDALAAIQAEDPRLQIHANSCATETNMAEIRRLTTYLFDRCPKLSHHNLAIIRGDRKDATLQGPALQQYRDLYHYIRRLWKPREESRMGAVVEPMLQWTKLKAAEAEQQFVPCRAGILTGVIHANGDVGICEQRPPIGNLREKSFMEIWRSHHADEVRRSIAAKECYCTNEVFMWPSIVFQPRHLARAALGARVWESVDALPDGEKADYGDALPEAP
ncbi:MAG: radical SAM/SPASM domain-containing protein [Myxococcota bacterium]